MSKLESAFSKALKGQQEQKYREGLNSSGQLVQSEDDTASLSNIVSARKQIARMQQRSLFTEKELAKKRIIYSGMRDTKLLNIYRTIRTKILALMGQQNFSILVTSVVPSGGTSLIAANLASVFALDEGKTAILIDANLQVPTLDQLFELEHQTGLVDYLESENMDLDTIIHQTGIPRLRYVPSGSVRESSKEYLTSQRMGEVIDIVLKRYPDRYPIYDAPSIADSADARILIELCDKVILVVPYGKCSEAEIKNAAQTIGEKKLAGLILNEF